MRSDLQSAHPPVITNIDWKLEQLKSFVAERGAKPKPFAATLSKSGLLKRSKRC
jgi:hypothetical protein